MKDAIETEALKLISRFETHARQIADEQVRRDRRTTQRDPRLKLRRPHHWSLAPGFNPYLVRASSAKIAHSIALAMKSGSYAPRAPYLHLVPKVGGGKREVSIFQVADNAVSKKLFAELMEKNRTRFSSRAYAYRADVSVHDAIHYVSRELRGQSRVFVAEYDFSKFFDNISHDYLWKILRDREFLLTRSEERQVSAFLRTQGRQSSQYDPAPLLRVQGVPQGTSISLFLANVAAWELDRELEKLGVSFVRYADDTLIWSTEYAQICRAVDSLCEISIRIGAPINFAKSGGVHLLGRGGRAEMADVPRVDYLGHSVDLELVSMKKGVVARVKKKIERLIYFNLLREPLRSAQERSRFGRVDKDYVVLIWQLRRYLYGNLSERGVRRLSVRGAPARRFRGLMSFFPLVDDEEQLTQLDRWLAWRVWLAMRKRYARLRIAGLPTPPPHQRHLEDLVGYMRPASTGGVLDLRLPSFRRMSRLIRIATREHGTRIVARALKYEYPPGAA